MGVARDFRRRPLSPDGIVIGVNYWSGERWGQRSLDPERFLQPQVMIDFFFSSRRRHTRFDCDWSSDVYSSDLSVAVNFLRVCLLLLEEFTTSSRFSF